MKYWWENYASGAASLFEWYTGRPERYQFVYPSGRSDADALGWDWTRVGSDLVRVLAAELPKLPPDERAQAIRILENERLGILGQPETNNWWSSAVNTSAPENYHGWIGGGIVSGWSAGIAGSSSQISLGTNSIAGDSRALRTG